MSYHYLDAAHLGSSKAGATITATVTDSAGTPLSSQPTRTVVNLGGGVFGIDITDMPSSQYGWILLKEGATVLAALAVAPLASIDPALAFDGSTPIAADVRQWKSAVVPDPHVAGVPIVDLSYINGDPIVDHDATVASAVSATEFTLTWSSNDFVPGEDYLADPPRYVLNLETGDTGEIEANTATVAGESTITLRAAHPLRAAPTVGDRLTIEGVRPVV